LDFEKNVVLYSFTGHALNYSALITQLPKVSTGKSRSPTSEVLRSADTRNYATENCVW